MVHFLAGAEKCGEKRKNITSDQDVPDNLTD